jgi:hypothetical protein
MRNGLLALSAILLAGGALFAEEPKEAQLPPVPPRDSSAALQDSSSGTRTLLSLPKTSLDGLKREEDISRWACPEDPFGCRELFWAQADYLMWWTRNSHLPPLVTTGSPADSNPGALGQPGTSVLFGGSVNSEPYSGGRFSAGLWFNSDHSLGIEGGYLFLAQRTVRFGAVSDGTRVLARPFFDVTPGSDFENAENAQLLAFPGLAAGSVDVTLSTRVQGCEADLASEMVRCDSSALRLLAGFRYLSLDDSLNYGEATAFLPDVPVFGGDSLVSASSFNTKNRFYGGQLGAAAAVDYGRLSLNLRAMIGLGSTHQTVLIDGTTTTTSAVGIANTIGSGPFALPSNLGSHSRDVFSAVPEVRVNGAYQVTDHLRLSVGYTFLAWSEVARSGDQIDRATNTSMIPPTVGPGNPTGPVAPQVTFRNSTFWAQGINFGIELRY